MLAPTAPQQNILHKWRESSTNFEDPPTDQHDPRNLNDLERLGDAIAASSVMSLPVDGLHPKPKNDPPLLCPQAYPDGMAICLELQRCELFAATMHKMNERHKIFSLSIMKQIVYALLCTYLPPICNFGSFWAGFRLTKRHSHDFSSFIRPNGFGPSQQRFTKCQMAGWTHLRGMGFHAAFGEKKRYTILIYLYLYLYLCLYNISCI